MDQGLKEKILWHNIEGDHEQEQKQDQEVFKEKR